MPLVFVHSQKGKNQLVHDGYRFNCEKTTDTQKRWKCSEYNSSKCKSRVHTEDDKVVHYANVHNHVPQCGEIEKIRVLNEIKDKCTATVETPSLLLARALESATPAVQSSLPRADAIKKMVRRKRRVINYPMSSPKSLTELDIPEEFKVTAKNEMFLQFDSGKDETRIMIFATESNLQILKNSRHIYADGTFKTAPLLFAQVFTIHALVHGITISVVYALLPNKQEVTYNRLLSALKTIVPNLQLTTITTDFEMGLLNAFRTSFPTIKQKGCYFHFGQCLWRRIQLIPQAVSLYKSNPDFAVHLRCLGALAFVPVCDVITAFEQLQDSSFFTRNENMLRPLMDYFEDNWIGRLPRRGLRRAPVYNLNLWNVFEATCNSESTTNNSLEGWHRGFSVLLGADHPVIWKFLDFMKKEQSLVELQYDQACNGMAPMPQRKAYKESAARISRIVHDYNNRPVKSYLRAIANNIEFNV